MPAQHPELMDHRSPDPDVRRAAYNLVRAAQNLPPLTDAEWDAEQTRAHKLADKLRGGIPTAALVRATRRLSAA